MALEKLDKEAMLQAIELAPDVSALEALRVEWLGRKGTITEQLKQIGKLEAADRAAAGAAANQVRQAVEAGLAAREEQLRLQASQTAQSYLDVTAPGLMPALGHRHPVTSLLDELVDVFWQMGYQVAEGPEVETEWYNFEALNIPADHPARDMQDTFYLEGAHLPRTHTSGIQIRYLEAHKDNLPVRIIAPGKVYRNEDEDPRHSWIFYQLEGLVVDEGINVGHLKGTLTAMMQGVLGPEANVRLRPNYFPYTEPSVEMDATCVACIDGQVQGAACRLCGGSGWLELGGAGMIHPQVLRNVGIDPEVYSGFAFGFGPERIATIKYGLSDVREFWRPNFKFLEQF
jgi:phenylalanyl-tRNA synthetase alpha chain